MKNLICATACSIILIFSFGCSTAQDTWAGMAVAYTGAVHTSAELIKEDVITEEDYPKVIASQQTARLMLDIAEEQAFAPEPQEPSEAVQRDFWAAIAQWRKLFKKEGE